MSAIFTIFFIKYEWVEYIIPIFAAHVIHLDLKVKNLMIMPPTVVNTRRGLLKIIDFGGAIKLNASKLYGSKKNMIFRTHNISEVIGSFEFYAPEQRIDYYYKFVDQNDSTAASLLKNDFFFLTSHRKLAVN